MLDQGATRNPRRRARARNPHGPRGRTGGRAPETQRRRSTRFLQDERMLTTHNLRSECLPCVLRMLCSKSCQTSGPCKGHNIQDGNRMQHMLLNVDGQKRGWSQDGVQQNKNMHRKYHPSTILTHKKKKKIKLQQTRPPSYTAIPPNGKV